MAGFAVLKAVGFPDRKRVPLDNPREIKALVDSGDWERLGDELPDPRMTTDVTPPAPTPEADPVPPAAQLVPLAPAEPEAKPVRNNGPPPEYARVPASLLAEGRWLTWMHDTHAGNKPPCNKDGRKVDSYGLTFEAAVAQLAALPFPDALEGAHPSKGLGLDKQQGVDFDNCIGDDGSIDPRAEAIIESLPGYVEHSPSGKGLKLFCKVADEQGPCWYELNFTNAPTLDRKALRYFTVTGRVFRDGDPQADASHLVALVRDMLTPTPNTVQPKPLTAQLPEAGFAVESKQDDWLHARAVKHAGKGLQFEDVLAQLRVDVKRCPQKKAAPWTEADLIRHAKGACHFIAQQPKTHEGKPDLARVEVKPVSEVEETKVKWLWHARLAQGALSLLEGRPEQGKTLLSCEIAARESRGDPFPGETARRTPGAVVMLVAEDDIAATIKPRLRAAGADLSRVHVLSVTRDETGQPVPFSLSDDVERLRAECVRVGATLITVDPLVSFIGSRNGRAADTNNDHQTRKALLPLKSLAEDTKAAILAIRHYKKGRGTDAVEAGGGSIAFSAVARVLLAAVEDPDQDGTNEHHLFAVAKNNLVAKKLRPSIRYEIVPWEKDSTVPRIAWGSSVDLSAGEVLAQLAQRDAQRAKPGARQDARDWLRAFLATGRRPASEVLAEAESAGYAERTLRRALPGLVQSVKVGKGWQWELVSPQGELFGVPS